MKVLANLQAYLNCCQDSCCPADAVSSCYAEKVKKWSEGLTDADLYSERHALNLQTCINEMFTLKPSCASYIRYLCELSKEDRASVDKNVASQALAHVLGKAREGQEQLHEANSALLKLAEQRADEVEALETRRDKLTDENAQLAAQNQLLTSEVEALEARRDRLTEESAHLEARSLLLTNYQTSLIQTCHQLETLRDQYEMQLQQNQMQFGWHPQTVFAAPVHTNPNNEPVPDVVDNTTYLSASHTPSPSHS